MSRLPMLGVGSTLSLLDIRTTLLCWAIWMLCTPSEMRLAGPGNIPCVDAVRKVSGETGSGLLVSEATGFLQSGSNILFRGSASTPNTQGRSPAMGGIASHVRICAGCRATGIPNATLGVYHSHLAAKQGRYRALEQVVLASIPCHVAEIALSDPRIRRTENTPDQQSVVIFNPAKTRPNCGPKT